jgi:hypothetical protein
MISLYYNTDESAGWMFPDSLALRTQRMPVPLSQNLKTLFARYPTRSLKRDGLTLLNNLATRSARQPDLSVTMSNQQPNQIRYDRYGAVLLAASRMPSWYAATRRVLHEVHTFSILRVVH